MMTYATHKHHACIQSDAAPCLDSVHVFSFFFIPPLTRFDAYEWLSVWNTKIEGRKEVAVKDGEMPLRFVPF